MRTQNRVAVDFWVRQYRGNVIIQKIKTTKQSCQGFLGWIIKRERHIIENEDYKIELLGISGLDSIEGTSYYRKKRLQNRVAVDFWVRQYRGNVIIQKIKTTKQSCQGFLGQIVQRDRHNIENKDYKIELLGISKLDSIEGTS